MDQAVVLTEVTDRIGVITMNRPERRNALNGALILGLQDAVQRMAADPEVKVVVLTGAAPAGGHGGFCAGGDVREGAGEGASAVPHDALDGDLARHDLHASLLLHCMPKPTIAMVGGPAVGAGCSLAAACDLRFASDDAVFASAFTANGLSGDYGGTFLWTRIIGTARTRELYLLNDRVDAATALEWGMVNRVFPAAELRERTMEVARQLSRTPAGLLGLVKDNLNQAEDEVERRRWLFANEAVNQGRAVSEIRERMRRRAEREAGAQPG